MKFRIAWLVYGRQYMKLSMHAAIVWGIYLDLSLPVDERIVD